MTYLSLKLTDLQRKKGFNCGDSLTYYSVIIELSMATWHFALGRVKVGSKAMATVIHLLSIIDYNFIILGRGLKYYKTRIVKFKYVYWMPSKAS